MSDQTKMEIIANVFSEELAEMLAEILPGAGFVLVIGSGHDRLMRGNANKKETLILLKGAIELIEQSASSDLVPTPDKP